MAYTSCKPRVVTYPNFNVVGKTLKKKHNSPVSILYNIHEWNICSTFEICRNIKLLAAAREGRTILHYITPQYWDSKRNKLNMDKMLYDLYSNIKIPNRWLIIS